ncbi:MAG: hypothetical protein U5J95_03775 [Balneolaceae bacterium]|nr:hypothetical protein [Balneolaceae bacterium]
MNQNRYSAISTINHWVTALLVVVMLALGYAVAAAPSEIIEDLCWVFIYPWASLYFFFRGMARHIAVV